MSFTYDKPTEAGVYLCCYGDVPTPENMWATYLDSSGVAHDMTPQGFVNPSQIEFWSSSIQYKRIEDK